MKMWVGLVVLMTLSFSSAVLLRGAEQEDKSEAPGTSSSPDTQVKRMTGQLTHIDGWHYTIKDSRGEEVSFGVTSETQDPDKVKEGDHIVAMVGEDRIARSIKNMKKKS
jgi:hypothetical protein